MPYEVHVKFDLEQLVLMYETGAVSLKVAAVLSVACWLCGTVPDCLKGMRL